MERSVVAGSPDEHYIPTSIIERQNKTLRMTPAMAANIEKAMWGGNWSSEFLSRSHTHGLDSRE